MSVRFEVILNGERLCISGIEGNGVLSNSVSFVQREGEEPTCKMYVGGLGAYHPSDKRDYGVAWVNSKLKPGDELVIRVLPPGNFDVPKGMLASPEIVVADPLFGDMEFGAGAWNSDISLELGPFTSAHIHIWADKNGPTESQRDFFSELVKRFERLWPDIKKALLTCHDTITNENEFDTELVSHVDIDMHNDPMTLSMTFHFEKDPEFVGYMIKLRDWVIVEVLSLE